MTIVVETAATWITNTAIAALAAAGWVGPTSAAAYAVINTVSQIALYVGMEYAIDSVQRPKQRPLGAELNFNIDAAYPREMIVGERLVGGSMVARYSRGSNLYNAHMVIQLADHPCTELSKVYDGGRLVQATALSHGVRTEITAYSNSGGPRVWMTWHDGRAGQTADSDLVTKSAQDPEVVAGKIEGWTSNHRGAGCAYVHVEVQWDSDILTSIPQFTFLVKGAPLYDRRLDSTAGGSGDHRLDDPSTWEYSTNARVALDHYLLGYKVEDDDLAFGIGLSPEEVPYADFEAGADLCDEDVETGTGDTIETIKRYAANGVISAADYFEDVIENFQLQMAARVVDLGGRIGVIGAEERPIIVELTRDDLVAGEPFQFADRLPFSDLYGSVTGRFSDPGNLYQPTPLEPILGPYNTLPDGGEAQAADLQLPYEVHPRRAARLTSAWFERESLQPRLIGVFMPKAWKLEPGDWFTFSDDTGVVGQFADGPDGFSADATEPTADATETDEGDPITADESFIASVFEVIDIVKNEDFTVVITARAIDPVYLAFSNDNDPAVSATPAIDPADRILTAPEFDAEASVISGGGVTEVAIAVTLTSDEVIAREVVYEYGEENPDFDPEEPEDYVDNPRVLGPTAVEGAHIEQIVTNLRKNILPGTTFVVRAKTRAGVRESPWSDWSAPVATGAGPADAQVFLKTATWASTSVPGVGAVLLAEIDVDAVAAGGYLTLNTGSYLFPEVACDISDGGTWAGELVLTEQLQSGGSEVELETWPLEIEDTGGLCVINWPDDVLPWPSEPVAHTLSGDVTYRLKIRRTSGSNSVTGDGVYGKLWLQRTPG